MTKHIFTLILLAAAACMPAMAQAQLQFDQVAQELGTVLWHTPRTATFKFTNKTANPIKIKDVRSDCGCTAVNWTRITVEPGATGFVTATYDAELLGRFDKSLAVYTDIKDEPYMLRIMGEVAMTQKEPSSVYPYRIGDYYLSTDDIEFDNVNRGEMPVYTLHVYNGSKKTFSPELMHLPKYLTAHVEPADIRPGRVGTIELTLNSNLLSTMGLTQTSIYLSRFMGDRVNKDTEINVSATLLPDFLETPTQKALAPVAQIDSTHITLGPFNKKGKATGQLLLRNAGKTPLIISALQVYNPGISVSIGKRTLLPGAVEKLKISVSDNNRYFKGKRSILLITNDPQNPKMVIDVEVKQ